MLYTTNLAELLPVTNEYTLKGIERVKAITDEVKAFIPSAITIYSYHENEGRKYFEVAYTLVNELSLIVVTKREHDKHYNVICYGGNQFRNVDSNQRKEIYSQHKQPNNIGKLSLKKLNEWIAYEMAIYIAIEAKNKAIIEAIAAFKDSIANEPITWYKDGVSGYMHRNGLRYSFQIYKNGYVEQKVELWTINDNLTPLERFKKLSENQY